MPYWRLSFGGGVRFVVVAAVAGIQVSMAWAHDANSPVVVIGGPDSAEAVGTGDPEKGQEPRVRLGMPLMDPENGMRLFAGKGCVVCHAVNGTGEHNAKNLDAHSAHPVVSAFAFSAKMWAIPGDMVDNPDRTVGHRFAFSGDELADIAAFASDDDQQHEFTEAHIPPEIRKLMRHSHGGKPAHQDELRALRPIEVYVVAPMMDSEQGMRLFVSKGCVACHAANGVGGRVATNLDAHSSHTFMNPFDFAAKMWAVIPGVAEVEARIEGHRFLFTAVELSDIMAFVHDGKRQRDFTEADLPPEIERPPDHIRIGQPAHQE